MIALELTLGWVGGGGNHQVLLSGKQHNHSHSRLGDTGLNTGLFLF